MFIFCVRDTIDSCFLARHVSSQPVRLRPRGALRSWHRESMPCRDDRHNSRDPEPIGLRVERISKLAVFGSAERAGCCRSAGDAIRSRAIRSLSVNEPTGFASDGKLANGRRHGLESSRNFPQHRMSAPVA